MGAKAAALELFDVDGQRLIRSGVLDEVQIAGCPHNALVVSARRKHRPRGPDRSSTSLAVAQISVFRIRKGDATAMATMLQTCCRRRRAR